MGLLGDLLDARLGEAFDEHKIRRDGDGQFADKPGMPPLPKVPRPRAGKPAPVAPGAAPNEVPRGTPRLRKLPEAELPKRVGTGSWSKGVDATLKDLQSGQLVDTEQAYRKVEEDGSLGYFSPERIELHKRIATLLLRHAHEHPGEARAVFLAGGPASGKSSLTSSGLETLPADGVDVNPDIVRAMLPEYEALVKVGDPEAAAKTHEEASHVSKMVMNLALMRDHHVIVDGVGAGAPGRFARKIKRAQAAGHTTEVVYASIPTDEAVARASRRAKKSGRHVPLGYLREAHREVSERFVSEIQHLPNVSVRVYDNSGKGPVLTAERSPAQREMQVQNKRLYEAFVKKARAV